MRLRTLLVMVVILCLSGCRDSNTSIPQNAYRLEAEDLVDQKGVMFVKRLAITAHGTRTIGIGVGQGNRDQARANPDRRSGNDLITVDIIILADLIDDSMSQSKLLRWLVQVKCGSTTMCGPSLLPAPASMSLEDIVTLNVQPGEHSVGQPLVLGRLQGKEILLTVK